MPKPRTESLSVSAPRLNFSVSHIPLNTSAMKKRFTFSFKVGRGTLTKGIKLSRPLCVSSVLGRRRRRRRRHGRRALRHVHEPNLPPLLLEVEVARVSVEIGEEERGDQKPRRPERDGDALAFGRQVETRRAGGARRLQRVEAAPPVEPLER